MISRNTSYMFTSASCLIRNNVINAIPTTEKNIMKPKKTYNSGDVFALRKKFRATSKNKYLYVSSMVFSPGY